MSDPQSSRHSIRQRALWYGLALLAPIGVTLLESRSNIPPLFPFLFLVVAIARLGTLGPGLLAAVWSTLLSNYFFVGPRGELSVSNGAARTSALFFILSCAAACMVHTLRQRTDHLAREARRLHNLQRCTIAAAHRRARSLKAQTQLLHQERLELTHALRRSLRAQDDFLAVAAHELNTPLTALTLQMHGLMRRLGRVAGRVEPEVVTLSLQRQADSLKRLCNLVSRVLDVPAICGGHLRFRPVPIDLYAVVQEVIRDLHDVAEQARCPLTIHSQAPILGRWDRDRLEQVVSNLLFNAFKYGRGAPVLVEMQRDGDSLRMAITDHGVGIPTEDQQRIFERYERTGDARPFAGLGLGLWLVREIVEASGGGISVHSQPGRGATFEVRVPLML